MQIRKLTCIESHEGAPIAYRELDATQLPPAELEELSSLVDAVRLLYPGHKATRHVWGGDAVRFYVDTTGGTYMAEFDRRALSPQIEQIIQYIKLREPSQRWMENCRRGFYVPADELFSDMRF